MQHDRYPNKGKPPRNGDAIIWVALRNGMVGGPSPAKYWRFKPWDWGESAGDVVTYWKWEG